VVYFYAVLFSSAELILVNLKLSHVIIDWIKYMAGYEGSQKESIAKQGKSFILRNFEHYGPDDVRSVQEF